MSPKDLRALLGLYRDAMAALQRALDDERMANLDADQLRDLLRDVVAGYEARIPYERLEAALAHSENLSEAVFGKAVPPQLPGKPKLTLVEGGKDR